MFLRRLRHLIPGGVLRRVLRIPHDRASSGLAQWAMGA